MILQALTKYYERIVQDGAADVEPEGFKRVAIPFVLVLKKDGSLAGIDDTRSGEGRKAQARTYIVPRIFEGSRTVNVKANLLWDKASYIFGIKPDGKSERLLKQKEKFISTIIDYFPDQESDDGVKAVVNFITDHQDSIKAYTEWEEISFKDPFLAFRLDGEHELVCNSNNVIKAIAKKKKNISSESGLCLVTGELEDLTPLENPIKGLRGSGKGESHLVAFNESAYWSYGKGGKKLRHRNAQISKSASAAYVTAINYMQRDTSKQWLKVGDATAIFWTDKKNVFEDWFIDIFNEPAKGKSDQDNAAIRALFNSMKTGVQPSDWSLNHFYVLGLAPNSARIAVRFWYAGTVADVASNIMRYFRDIEIDHAKYEMPHCTLNRMLASTALETKDPKKANRVYYRGKYYDVTPNLAGDFMKAILAGTPYPRTLLSAVIIRMKAEQSKKDSKTGKSIHNVSYPRAALIKAILSREAWYRKSNKKEVGMSLDISNSNPGYLLGRLFAVLEKIQEEAAKPNKLNATIRDRFYGSASSTPVVAFSHLMKLKNHHLSKMDNYKGYYEGLIGEIMNKMDSNNPFPSNLSLDDQGRFAVGYYHQRYYKKKETKE